MTFKRYITLSISGIMLILFFAATVMVYCDPFVQYHKPQKDLTYRYETNLYAYINPGIAKNYDYDTVVMGSSMSRTFQPSYIDKVYDGHTVKLSMAEARGKDIFDMSKVVFSNKKNIKRMIIGLDTFAFNVDKNFTSHPKPMYLYDKYIFNDVPYLFNMDNLLKCVELKLNKNKNLKTITMDEYQNYALENTFSKKQVSDLFRQYYNPHKEKRKKIDYDKKIVVDNLRSNLVPFIKKNPKTEFLFYFPPYSVAKWGLLEDREYELKIMQTMIEELLPYKNVKLYFYQGNVETITNLDNYMDTIHFDVNIANDIVKTMSEEKYLLTKENYKEILRDFKEYILSYPYEEILRD
ncbi:hypothetical protein [Faecalimonas sp.]